MISNFVAAARPRRDSTSWHLTGLSGSTPGHTANSSFQHRAPYLGDEPDWCCLHLPQLRSWRLGVHSGIGAPLPITAVQYLSLQQLQTAQAYSMRRIWPRTPGSAGKPRHRECVSDGALESWDGGREKDISVPRWALSSLWSFVPSGLAGSQTLMGLVWLCVCRKKSTNSSCPGSVKIVVC